MKKELIKINVIITICVFTLINSNVFASHSDSLKVYKVNHWVTGIIDVGGTVANFLSINRIYNKPTMTDADFQRLNRNAFSKFDQRAFKQDPTKWKQMELDGYYAMGGTIALPLLLGFDKNINKDWTDILLMYYEVHMVTFGIYNYSPIGPTFVNKYRPMVYYDQLSYDERRSGKNNSSFYSGHVASTVASTFFMVKVYSDYHPQIGWKKYLLYGAATLPGLLVADLRIKALKHFPSDNMVGLGLGMIVGVAVPELHKIRSKRGISLSIFSSNGDSGLTLNWKLDEKKSKNNN